MSIEIRIGKMKFPVVSVARIENDDDFLFVYVADGKFWGQSIKTKMIAPLRFKSERTTWGNKTVKFV
jgi:hypothetical protein